MTNLEREIKNWLDGEEADLGVDNAFDAETCQGNANRLLQKALIELRKRQ